MNYLARQAQFASLPPHVQDEIARATALVEKCTSEILLAVDWAMNMELVDMVNRASCQEVRREIVRQVRKRLQHRSTRVVSLALTLSETLVKNCNTALHREVATPKFMAQMGRIARTYTERTGKENLEVADKALEIIQSWGETFLPQSSTMPLFAQTYHDLRLEGLPFRRQYDESKVPILTPTQTVPSKPKKSAADEELLSMTETSVTMLKDIMSSADSLDDLEDNDIFKEVLEQCKGLVRQLQGVIERKVGEGEADNIEDFFTANDGLQLAMQTYEGVKAGSIALPLPREDRRASVASSDDGMEDLLGLGSDSGLKPPASPTPLASKPSADTPPAVPTTTLLKPPEADTGFRLPPPRRDGGYNRQSSGRMRRAYSRGASNATDLLDIGGMSLDSSVDQSAQLSKSMPAVGTSSATTGSSNAGLASGSASPFGGASTAGLGGGVGSSRGPSGLSGMGTGSINSSAVASGLSSTGGIGTHSASPTASKPSSAPDFFSTPNPTHTAFLSSSLNPFDLAPPLSAQPASVRGSVDMSGSVGGTGLGVAGIAPVKTSSVRGGGDVFTSAPNLDPFASVPPLPPPRTYASPPSRPSGLGTTYNFGTTTASGPLGSPSMGGISTSGASAQQRPLAATFPGPQLQQQQQRSSPMHMQPQAFASTTAYPPTQAQQLGGPGSMFATYAPQSSSSLPASSSQQQQQQPLSSSLPSSAFAPFPPPPQQQQQSQLPTGLYPSVPGYTQPPQQEQQQWPTSSFSLGASASPVPQQQQQQQEQRAQNPFDQFGF